MAEDNKVDLVAQLPDEVLMEIFGHLPSLRDKLRLESVNTRFQRCLLGLLRTRPIPFIYTGRYAALRGGRLNGYRLPAPLADVLKSVGRKVKFNSVDIHVYACSTSIELDSVLAALASPDTDCLDKVTTFKVISNHGCNENLLKDVFSKCIKLSDVRLYVDMNDAEVYSGDRFPVNLGAVLKEKPLTRLAANLFSNTQEQVIQMFQSIKPNTLKKIVLRLRNTALNMDVLVTELRGGGWSALEEIDIERSAYNMSIDTLFSSLNRLPKLRKCNFVLQQDMQNVLHLVPALTSLAAGLKVLFTNQAEVTVNYGVCRFHPSGCQFVALIRQVQSVHPDLEVGFGSNGRSLTLTLGEVSFKQRLYRISPCDNAECPECRIFYPTVLFRIAYVANELMRSEQQEMHLANARLDRCAKSTLSLTASIRDALMS